ncbi:MAG TPA: 2-hydroxychromene-2-carboxylate isomerase [Polaromonas sp.]|uniref:2-hydroxychromene-2-carboxylate isomerase n=1 Tax=Polaromonas sp. TaxID=1869339 RepID=UPI002D3E1B33|nr:2-hydroxychromene-2-carboxylate isomerase [Polaromonas sp.]HYW56215.1 2-hydroxychromene-2-carboxylate isomerase [Polaromonas sp.]
MKHITFYLDFISPYAYLAFEKLPETLKGITHSVTYKPLLFASLLKHHWQLGPAEIESKRDWTYRQVLWLASQQGTALQMPASHPFNPLALLRLAIASDAQGAPNRYVCETLFRHVWLGGHEAADVQRLEAVTAQLAPQRAANSDEVKAQLKAHSDEAIAAGVFGVPTFVVDGKAFWGLDALPMLRDYLCAGAFFAESNWDSVSQVSQGIPRRK